MTNKELAELAFRECSSAETTVRYGVKRGLPFWNVESTQFMYVPAFHFTAIRGCSRYRYTAVDELGGVHTFEANDCCVLLTPIWAELPEGVVHLTVTALRPDGTDDAIVGARTFFRLAPFPGDTPPRVCSYRDCAVKAYRFAMSQGFIRHWLEHGTPDPGYDLNTYPSKMIGSLGKSMLSYARLCPEDAENAMKVAVSAADYLISITPRTGALADLPPTYYLDFCPDPEKYGIITPNWHAACAHYGTMMMIYPAAAGEMYVELEGATGNPVYLEEALKIGRYYRDTMEENGSWYLVRNCETGKPVTENYISPLESVTPFLMALWKRTGDAEWKALADRSVEYVLKTQLPSYNWEGQFEDSPLSTNYMNLTHYGPTALAEYYADYHADDPEAMELAKELMRFVEDQFVIWKRPYPWVHATPDPNESPYDTSLWHTPAGLEQYGWYVPIDASADSILLGFLALYKAGCGGLYLAKAKALADQLTRVQHENGQIPTHWMGTESAEKNFWFNCMFASCRTLEAMAEYEDVEP